MHVMPPDLALLSTLIGSNYPYLEFIAIVPKLFEPSQFDCIALAANTERVVNTVHYGVFNSPTDQSFVK